MILKKHKKDIILILSLLIVSTIALLFMLFNKKGGSYAVVVINGVETQSLPLSTNTEITLKNGNDFNVLVIEDGKAYIKDASCPDKLCVKQHTVQYNGETLVCLPNKITVKIISDTEADTDFIS